MQLKNYVFSEQQMTLIQYICKGNNINSKF